MSFKTQFKIEFLGPFNGPKKSLKKTLSAKYNTMLEEYEMVLYLNRSSRSFSVDILQMNTPFR